MQAKSHRKMLHGHKPRGIQEPIQLRSTRAVRVMHVLALIIDAITKSQMFEYLEGHIAGLDLERTIKRYK